VVALSKASLWYS